MTGVLNAMVGMPTASRFNIVLGVNVGGTGNPTDTGAPQQSGSSISPSTYKGYPILFIYSRDYPDAPELEFDLKFALNTTEDLFQGFFQYLLVQDGSGVFRTLRSADATFETGVSSVPVWTWGNGSNPVWTVADDDESKILLIY